MKPIRFHGANTNYVSDTSDDLPAMVQQDESGNTQIVSVWELDAEDLETISRGGKVCLCLYGAQPPVALWTQEVDTVE